MSDDYPLVPVEFRIEPGGKRMAMRIPDQVEVMQDRHWFVVGWATGSGIIRWHLTDDDVAEWTQVVAP